MKSLTSLLSIVAFGALSISSFAADRPQGLSIEDALKIAENYLRSANPSEPRSIVALTLETTTVRGASYWYAKWSGPILSGDSKPELGLRIDMDGSLTKVVASNRGPGNVVPGVGEQKFGARNMR